ncbi:MAG: metal ABC transporter permease [Parachlamydiaceae bacterium]
MLNVVDYFFDPVLRAPMIASMLMCMAASLVGVVVFLRKESLLGEALSHASYPGVVLGIMLIGLIWGDQDLPFQTSLAILGGAGITALLGIFCIQYLQKKGVHPDASLCFVLSSFFGIGILLASDVQFRYSYLYRQIQVYFYGQSATMTDIHTFIYGTLTLVIIFALLLLKKELKIVVFDELYAKTQGINTRLVTGVFFFLIVLSLVVGIRSVGVVLMSGMLIAPAAAARQYTNRLSSMFLISAFFGLCSAFLGTYLSVEVSRYLAILYPSARLALPSGPLIVLIATLFCLFSLLFAKERGLAYKQMRSYRFSYQCQVENLLKTLWRQGETHEASFDNLKCFYSGNALFFRLILQRMIRQGWLERTMALNYKLTQDGAIRAARIVRLHRLWEVYLADYLGVGIEKVHKSAEEMEHIITPEIEKELTLLLNDPKEDPHAQPIPKKDR